MRSLLTGIILISTALSVYAQNAGFFIEDNVQKTAIIPGFTEREKPAAVPSVTITVDVQDEIAPVSRYLFGNNANIYMTQMVDQPALLEHIRTLSPNIIRFPGGNLSSVYFWNAEKDQPPADAPAKLVD